VTADARFARGPEAIFAAQTATVLAGFHFAAAGAWIAVMVAVAALGLVGWKMAFARSRMIADLPTSRVASAAQGYVELQGIAALHDGYRLFSKHGNAPCVWYRFVVDEKMGRNWRRIDDGASPDTFILRDRTGDCVIDPEGAEVLASNRRIWHSAPYRYTEWIIGPGDPLYALGAFSAIDLADPQADLNADIRTLLSEWKRNQPDLIARFDTNGDGKIDLVEWERAREAARAQVASQHRDVHRLPGLHLMRKPADNRLYVLSNLDPAVVLRRFRWWSIAQFGILCASTVAAAALAVRLHLL